MRIDHDHSVGERLEVIGWSTWNNSASGKRYNTVMSSRRLTTRGNLTLWTTRRLPSRGQTPVRSSKRSKAETLRRQGSEHPCTHYMRPSRRLETLNRPASITPAVHHSPPPSHPLRAAAKLHLQVTVHCSGVSGVLAFWRLV